MRQSTTLILLAVLALAGLIRAQSSKSFAKAQAKAQAKWCDYRRERQDLTKGAWEVLRFPTGYEFKPRYKHDPKDKKRILNPDFYCTRCVREKRIPRAESREDIRLAQRTEPQVLEWIEKELEIKRPIYIEDAVFKMFIDLPPMPTKRYPNRFLRSELAELNDIFPKVTKKTTVLDSHKRAHLYLIRAHRLLRDFWWLAGSSNEKVTRTYQNLVGPYMGMKNKQEVFVFRKQKHMGRFLRWTTGVTLKTNGFCWHHQIDRAMMMTMHDSGSRDPATQNFFLHRLMHNYLDAYRTYSYKLPAWFQIGLGHWVERREWQMANCYCFSEGALPRIMRVWKWLPRIRKMVLSGDVQPFAQFCNFVEFGDFTIEYHMINYSLFCYMLSLGPEKMRVFIETLKDKKLEETVQQIQVRAFRKAYGISVLEFDAGWRRWVKAVYPLV